MIAATLACMFMMSQAVDASRRPDIVLLVADDLGWGDISCLDGDFPTPSIDRLATEGAVLENFYAGAATCTPSRFALFTGRYPWKSKGGLGNVLMYFDASHDSRGLRDGEVTIPERLGRVGYDTMLAGKWHLGHGQDKSNPKGHGFDEFHGCRGGCVDYFTHAYGYMPDWWHGLERIEEEGEATDLIAASAVEFIRRHDRDTGDQDPIFLVVSFTAPHYGKSTLQQMASDSRTLITRAAGKPRQDSEGNTWQSANSLQATSEDLEAVGVALSPDPEVAMAVINDGLVVPLEKRRAYYSAMLKALDDGVAEVLRELKASGRGDALVLFTADNGPDETVSNAGNSGRFKGAKASLHEGGIRVPTILRWPGVVDADSRISQLGGFIDLHPTVCAIAGVEIPPDAEMDGVDISSGWRGKKDVPRTLLFRQGGSRAVRQGDWKWINGHVYNLKDDPGEKKDLVEDEPERAEKLKAVSR